MLRNKTQNHFSTLLRTRKMEQQTTAEKGTAMTDTREREREREQEASQHA